VAEAKSWVWPRADIEFREAVANDRNHDTLRSVPSGGLVFRYDFKRLLFHEDAAAISAAGRDICLRKARLAIDAAITRFEGYSSTAPVPRGRALEDQRAASSGG